MIDVEKLKKKINQRIEVLKLLSSIPRLRIMLLLLIFRKLSLTQLSDLLGRTKATVIHHLKKFEKSNIINTSREESQGSIDAKVYELDPEFFNLAELNIKNFQNLKKKESKEILHHILLRDKWMLETFKNILIFANQFYREIDEKYLSEDKKFMKKTQDFYFKSPIDYDLWFITEEGRENYLKALSQFKEQINKIINEDNKKGGLIERPYCILHLLLPLKDLSEFDFERKRIVDFLG
ncbi:MAG: ArsR family transcriptional regulator [Candidatus Lokiarchaeota archaeon]|nr:ArsR family transcriptional regulator [Candidatus Lokiarchaeota archaeon]